MSWRKMERTRSKELRGTPLKDCGGNVSHPTNDKVIGEAEDKWLVGATFQVGLAGGLHLSGKVIFGLAESGFNGAQRADT